MNVDGWDHDNAFSGESANMRRLLETEDGLRVVEQEINSWVDVTGAEIACVSGNVAAEAPTSASSAKKLSASDVLVIVPYQLTVG